MRKIIEDLAESLGNRVENFVFLDVVDSTHAMARRLIDQMAEEDIRLGATLVLAGRQTRGMGRLERRWSSPVGGLYLNWMHSGLSRATATFLPVLAAAAAHATVTDLGVARATIKWPNDILVDGRKLAGILVHARYGKRNWTTVGFGLNLGAAPTLDPGTTATAVGEHVPSRPFECWYSQSIVSFVQHLTRSLDDPQPALDSWRDNLVHRQGDRLTVGLGGGERVTGVFAGVTPEGFLKLEHDGEERVVSAGDVVDSG